MFTGRTGVIRSVLTAISKAKEITPSFMSRLRMRSRMRNGPANGYPQRQNGSLRREGGSLESLSCGVMIFDRMVSGWLTPIKGSSRCEIPVRTAT